MRPAEAVMELSRIGFRFRLDGEAVKVRSAAERPSDLAVVAPLVDLVKRNKDKVRHFLKSYSPRCGGAASCRDYEAQPLCLNCDWDELIRLSPDMAAVKHGG